MKVRDHPLGTSPWIAPGNNCRMNSRRQHSMPRSSRLHASRSRIATSRRRSIRASRPYRNWLTRWQPLAAAAAVAGLAFVLVQSLPLDRDVAPTIRIEEPLPSAATAQKELHSPPAGEASDAKAAQTNKSAAVPEPRAAADGALTQAVAPAPAASAPSAAVPAPVTTATTTDVADAAARATGMSAAEVDRRQEATSKASGGISSAEVAAPARERRQNAQVPLSTEDRTARIAALYAAGDTAGAEAALREFRAVDPDADTYLPDSLRDWARTVE